MVAIVLAAGRSSRMGRPKALLPHSDPGITFVAHLVRTLRAAGVSNVIVVGRSDDAALRDAALQSTAEFVTNEHPDEGQLSSVIAGIDSAEKHEPLEAVMIVPVDVPLITPAAIRLLIDRAAVTPAVIVRAAHAGRHGHPVIFKRPVFKELRRADRSLGAKAVVRADPGRVLDVEVGESGVTIDVDTPEDYERAFGRSL